MDREAKRALGWVVNALWITTLGSRTPDGKARYERMRNPEAGDLICEMSTLYRLLARDRELEDDRWDGQFVRYLRTETERYEWGGSETVYVCENPDRSEFRWTNADIIAVPQSRDFSEHLIDKYRPAREDA